MTETPVDDTKVAIGSATLNAQLPHGKNMAINVYLFEGEDDAKINTRLDQFFRVIDRQRARAEVPELEARRDQIVKALRDQKDSLEGLNNKRKNLPANKTKLSSNEEQMAANLGVTIERTIKDLQDAEKAIEETKRKGELCP